MVQTGAMKLRMNAYPSGQPLTRIRQCCPNKGRKGQTIGEISESKFRSILEFRWCGSRQSNNNRQAEPETVNFTLVQLSGRPTGYSKRRRRFAA
jgi:hypothetical protein